MPSLSPSLSSPLSSSLYLCFCLSLFLPFTSLSFSFSCFSLFLPLPHFPFSLYPTLRCFPLPLPLLPPPSMSPFCLHPLYPFLSLFFPSPSSFLHPSLHWLISLSLFLPLSFPFLPLYAFLYHFWNEPEQAPHTSVDSLRRVYVCLLAWTSHLP